MQHELDNLFSNVVEQVGIDSLYNILGHEYAEDIFIAYKSSVYSIRMALRFLECAHLSTRNLQDRSIDYQAVTRSLLGEESLPEKYTRRGAFSNRITTHNMIKLLSEALGVGAVNNALQYLQARPQCFAMDKWEEKISTEFNSDLMDAVAWEMQLKDEYFYSLGKKYTDQFAGHPFAQELAQLSPKQVYTVIFDHIIAYIEQSFDYKLDKLTDKAAIVERHFRPEMQDAVSNYKYSNKKGLEFSKGFASTMTKLTQCPFEFKVNTLKCPYSDNDHYGRFEIDFTNFRPLGERPLALVQ